MVRNAAALAGFFMAALASAQAQQLEIPRPVLEQAFQTADCQVPVEEAIKEPERHALGNDQQLIAVSCWTAAYNFGSVFFVMPANEPAAARLLRFRVLEERKWVMRNAVSGATFDPKTGLLRSYHKGRGLGDCGTAGEWKWDGNEFVLQRYWSKDKCDGRAFEPLERPRAYLIFPRNKR
jgi:hypothetical protein